MADEPRPAHHTIGLPSFLVEKPMGLGDAIKRVTSAVGVLPCGACDQRAAKLNSWLAIEPRSNVPRDTLDRRWR
jgi:hypothetical protein